MNTIFRQSFEKVAGSPVLYNPNHPSKIKPISKAPKPGKASQDGVFMRGFKKALPVLGTAAAVGGGVYGLLRRGNPKAMSRAQKVGKKFGLTKVVADEAPKGRVKKFLSRIGHGADKVQYSPKAKGGLVDLPSSPKKVKGRVLHEQETGAQIIQGKHDVGSFADKGVRKIEGNKKLEMKLLKQMDPKGMPKTVLTSSAHKGKKGLAKLDKSFKGENYYIKPNDGWGSGQGGVGFVTKKDVSAYLSGKKLNVEKTQKVKEFIKDPKKFTVQADMGIEKDITGQLKEFRVHAFGKDVVRGASSPRGKNLLGAGGKEQREAEAYLKKVLKKLPPEYRRAAMAADVVKTKDGYKIIELNAGSASSGLLSPSFIKKEHGALAGLEAVRKNQAVYKNLTGRSSQLEAGAKGLAGAGLTTGAGLATMGALEKRKKEKKEDKR